MSYVKSLRMVTCLICNRKVVEYKAVKTSVGRNAAVSAWLCKECAKDPKAAAEKRNGRAG